MTAGGPRSAQLLATAAEVIPGGVNSFKRKSATPICVRDGQGGRFTDLDGNRYIDFHCGLGPIILGHGDPAVQGAVADAMRRGVLFGIGTTDLEVQLAEKVVTHVPAAEQVVFCNSGSEATQHAIRLARAATGKQKILKFEGSYNGWHDYVLRNVSSGRSGLGRRTPGSAGMLDAAVDNTLICTYNDIEQFQQLLTQHGDELAAVIVEPIVHNQPTILPLPDFLATLRAACSRAGVVLIFDEVITGFRHALGGYQAICGVTPDLVTLGKAMANGYPIAALAGRRELMERFNTASAGDVLYGGTYNGNLPVVAAAVATITALEDVGAHPRLFELGRRMRAGLQEIVREQGVQAVVTGFGSLFCLSFVENAPRNYDDILDNDTWLYAEFRQRLLAEGIYDPPQNVRSHLCLAHTDSDLDEALEKSATALAAAIRARDAAEGSPMGQP